MKDIENQMETQSSIAEEAIASWAREFENTLQQEISYKTALMEPFTHIMTSDLSDHADDDEHTQSVESLRLKNEVRNTMLDDLLKNLSGKIEALEKDFPETSMADKQGLSHRITQLESQISEDQKTIAQLVATSASERQEIEKLQAESSSLEREKEKLREDLAEAINAKKAMEEEQKAMQTRLSELELLEAEFETRLEDSRNEQSELQAAFNAEKMLESEEYQQLESECKKLREEMSSVEGERERLMRLAGELEEELREASDAMQVYRTQEASDKATEMAAQAMRQQLDELRKQADSDRSALAKEREARVTAEREVERLRADLVALLDMNEQENDLDHLTRKAAGRIHARERSEIAELRKSLSRALDELMTSRKAEKIAEEKAAKASVQLTVCEQELLSAKSDLTYLIQTMDEMRESEDSRRAAMEHRISMLENEHEVLRRFHSNEAENLRTELTQAMMERDQLVQALKESEKSNSAMVAAATKGREEGSITENSLVDEVLKLRIEKAQLLLVSRVGCSASYFCASINLLNFVLFSLHCTRLQLRKAPEQNGDSVRWLLLNHLPRRQIFLWKRNDG